MTIMANDLKTRGVTLLDEALQQDDKVTQAFWKTFRSSFCLY